MIHTPLVVKAIVGIGVLGTFIQTAMTPVIPTLQPNFIDQVRQLGIDGLLALAVLVLWRKLQEKDLILMQNYRNMADALAGNKAVLDKMAETLVRIEEVVDRVDNVRQTIMK